jgi:hypothetical protein
MKLLLEKEHYGRITKEETKNKISVALKNKPKSKEHLIKMSETRKGKTI